MNTNTGKHLVAAFTIALAGLLTNGCGNQPPPPANGDDAAGADSFIGSQVAKGIAEAKRKLETGNLPIGTDAGININGRRYGGDRADDALPKAEITPQGDLLIAGEAITATTGQREMLLHHREQIIGIAHAGMAIGAQGAEIAGTALTGLRGLVFGGEEGRRAYEERIEAEADRIKQEAVKLCGLLPALYESQQALAASMPEFAPYATMTRQDVDECGEDAAGDTGVDIDTVAATTWSSNRHGATR